MIETMSRTDKATQPIDIDRNSANSSHETLVPRGSGVHTVHILSLKM